MRCVSYPRRFRISFDTISVEFGSHCGDRFSFILRATWTALFGFHQTDNHSLDGSSKENSRNAVNIKPISENGNTNRM
jgi:hypothetical protein